MAETIKLLQPDEIKVLKIIQINNKDINPFQAYLAYLRPISKVCDATNDDVVDREIFSAIQRIYPESKFYRKTNIFFQGELEYILERIDRELTKNVIVYFNPYVPSELQTEMAVAGTTLYRYVKEFSLRVELYSSNSDLTYICGSFNCKFPYDQIESLSSTIHPV
ncbi:MAG: hypothetical protein EOP52_12455 [Sphingobacteriales bacterium]|nr:MAG: hypothetical protein EOP52_12455 [Sphingobacteriales bacterium]